MEGVVPHPKQNSGCTTVQYVTLYFMITKLWTYDRPVVMVQQICFDYHVVDICLLKH